MGTGGIRAGAAAALVAGSLLWAANPPRQPIPFSHKQHAGALKLQCRMCHPNPDPGESMTIAPASACMQCHSTVKTGSPAVRALAQSAKDRKDVAWVRVYQAPSYVNYSHRTHLAAKIACAECHGNVAESDAVSREGDISMRACVNCHRMRKARVDCNVCHELGQ